MDTALDSLKLETIHAIVGLTYSNPELKTRKMVMDLYLLELYT